MRSSKIIFIFLISFLLLPAISMSQTIQLDEMPAGDGEWGYRPAEGSVSQVNPPSFSWRPTENITWEIQCAQDEEFNNIEYSAEGIEFNVHCPHRTFLPGTYTWRYRGKNKNGNYTNWSKMRTFTIAQDASYMPFPAREELLKRIPKTHPRLFLRPENLENLRELARGELKGKYNELVKKCEEILANPPNLEEPPKYPEGTESLSEVWREIWWGNRERTITALNGAATLAFTRLLGGQEKYGLEAKRIL